jgi:putative oxidoreductase
LKGNLIFGLPFLLQHKTEYMLKQILATKPNATLNNIALLILRVGISVLMIPHGYNKLVHFGEYKAKFMDFMGLGVELSLVLAIGAELICSILLALGFLTRFTIVPLVVTMAIATFKAHNGEIFGDGEHAFLYLIGYVALLFAGAGKFSVDGLILKK